MDAEKIKQKIIKEISNTEAVIARYEEMKKTVTNPDAVGRVSRMNEINNKTIAYASLNKAKAKLVGLRKVLSQIGTDAFGLCVKCHKPIALGRILIRPESLLCVKCAK